MNNIDKIMINAYILGGVMLIAIVLVVLLAKKSK